MDVYLAGQRHRLSDADLLGEGGEARVFRLGQLALKLFHAPTIEKVKKLEQFPRSLPPAVLAPTDLVKGRGGEVLGYAMPLVSGGEVFARLASRKWREGAVSNLELGQLFVQVHQTLTALHQQGVVVGDLNDGNLLFAGRHVHFIDVDSLQFGAFPCPVGHERFLDPRLYGIDLAQGPRFTPGSDWYAFAVMLFSSLLYVHPFGGTHATLGTLLRRAEARHSVLRSDVTLPRLALKPDVLPDDLTHWFHAVFEKDSRHEFPRQLLELSWHTCQCGTEHARTACPRCHSLGPLVTRQVLRANGRATARTAFETSGRVLTATMQGGLRYVYEEAGVVRREDGALVQSGPAQANTLFAVQGQSTWVVTAQGHASRVVQGRAVERAQSEVVGTTPVFGASAHAAYRVEAGWLCEQVTGGRVGQVLEGQTRIWVGPRLGLGFYRVGGLTVAFLFRSGKAGLKQVDGINWRGRLVEADAVFDAGHALLSVVVELGGTEVVHRWLMDEAGTVVARAQGGARGHAALLGGRVVLGTDGGLVALKNDHGSLVEAVGFPDTQPFVSAGDELLPNPDGSLWVVGARDIMQLTLT